MGGWKRVRTRGRAVLALAVLPILAALVGICVVAAAPLLVVAMPLGVAALTVPAGVATLGWLALWPKRSCRTTSLSRKQDRTV